MQQSVTAGEWPAYLGLLEVNGMKRLLISLCALALIAGAASADVPDPSNCTSDLDDVGRLLLIPGGEDPWQPNSAADFCVNVRNAADAPINNAVVEILVGGQAGNYVGICDFQELVKNTDVAGDVCFNIAGGGCYKGFPDACVIRANGVTIRTYTMVMSPDYTNFDNVGVPGRWDLTVAPTDLASFITAYAGGTGPASCHDYDNNLTTGPTDLAVFVASYYGGTGYCP
jgi:hypothetical protein